MKTVESTFSIGGHCIYFTLSSRVSDRNNYGVINAIAHGPDSAQGGYTAHLAKSVKELFEVP